MKIMVALNASEICGSNPYENDGFECLLKWWSLGWPLKMMALNTYENDGSFERL